MNAISLKPYLILVPINIGDSNHMATLKKLEDEGVVFGDLVPDDPLFREVTIPVGWRREVGDKKDEVYVVDAKGRRRIFMFSPSLSTGAYARVMTD